jgi:hypothetical protein
MGGPPDWCLGVGLTTPNRKKYKLVNVTKGLEPDLAQERYQWKGLVKKKLGSSSVAAQLAASQEGFGSM